MGPGKEGRCTRRTAASSLVKDLRSLGEFRVYWFAGFRIRNLGLGVREFEVPGLEFSGCSSLANCVTQA